MESASSSGVYTRPSLAPLSRMALSKALLPPTMMTSFFSPVVSGSCQIYFGSLPAMHAGSDPKYIWQLPDTTGLKNEVIMVGGRSAFDNAIRLKGAKLGRV